MRMFFGLVMISVLFPATLWAKPKWSIIVYAGIDEAEITHYTDPLITQMMTTPLPAGVELLIQRDSNIPGEDMRFIRRETDTSTPQPQFLPEYDSASVAAVTDFVGWVQKNATGQHQLLIILAHSWGWKGIIQDFTIPNSPGADTMMPLRNFTSVFANANFKPDITFFDACVLGNVEPVDEFQNISRYLVVSQRETPYTSLPYEKFLASAAQGLSPRELARVLPEEYVSSFARGGSKAKSTSDGGEGEYFPTTMVTIDTQNWKTFANQFKQLSAELKSSNLRSYLRDHPNWPNKYFDMDHNFDAVEMLSHIGDVAPATKTLAQSLINQIGYPEETADESSYSVTFDPAITQAFKIYIQADELVQDTTGDSGQPESVANYILNSWYEGNQDFQSESLNLTRDDVSKSLSEKGLRLKTLRKHHRALSRLLFDRRRTTHADGSLPKDISVGVCTPPEDFGFARTFCVAGGVRQVVQLRPWMRGTRTVVIERQGKNGKWSKQLLHREKDYVTVKSFSAESFMLSEAHTQGLPFIHGLGIVFEPLMDSSEERAQDPFTGTLGPDSYRQLSWNKLTGWGDLILLK